MKLWKIIQLVTVVFLQFSLGETFKGTIETAEEGKDYKPTEINLMVDVVIKDKLTTRYYRIKKNSGKGSELFEYVDKNVEVKGMTRKDNRGNRSIIITDYKIIEEEKEEVKKDPDKVNEEHLKPLDLGDPDEDLETTGSSENPDYSGY